MALYPALAVDRLPGIAAGLGGFALVLLVAALLGRWPPVVPWAVAFAGAEYAAFLLLRGGVADRWAPLVAAGLFLVSELGERAATRTGGAAEPVVVLRSAFWLAAGLIGTVALGAVLLGAAGGARAGVGLEALGVAAAVGALGFLVGLLARAGR